ncbi:MAG: helical backbone metal receptor [Woeseiaceae bacterium]|nr:helical backbone metal receptor [Woeseiaceae bacterium]
MIGRAGVLLALLALLAVACENQTLEPSSETAARVVTLAPHLAELMFAIGAGDLVVGVSAWSDFPEGVREIPVIGDAFTVDQEQLALLDPDLLLVWESGMPAHTVDQLRAAGYRVEVIRTHGVEDVALAMLRLGKLTGHERQARHAADRYRSELVSLASHFTGMERIRVFYQVSDRPLFTINGQHFLSELIGLCGGKNVFEDLDELAPAITDEAVVLRDPEVMIASDADNDPFAEWQRWPDIAANRYGNHFRISADTSSRPTPRLVEAGRQICTALESGRRGRAAAAMSDPGSREPPGPTRPGPAPGQ